MRFTELRDRLGIAVMGHALTTRGPERRDRHRKRALPAASFEIVTAAARRSPAVASQFHFYSSGAKRVRRLRTSSCASFTSMACAAINARTAGGNSLSSRAIVYAATAASSPRSHSESTACSSRPVTASAGAIHVRVTLLPAAGALLPKADAASSRSRDRRERWSEYPRQSDCNPLDFI